MSHKNKKTTCSAIEWKDFLFLIERLKRTGNFKTLLIVAIGGYTGLRVGDILQLKWNQLLNNSTLDLTESKTGKLRQITINPALQELVKYAFDNLCRQPNSYIFSNSKGIPLSRQSINAKLHALFEEFKIKVKNGSSHCLRKTFGRRIWESNDKSESALIMLGSIFQHSNISTTKRYLGITEEEIANVYLSM